MSWWVISKEVVFELRCEWRFIYNWVKRVAMEEISNENDLREKKYIDPVEEVNTIRWPKHWLSHFSFGHLVTGGHEAQTPSRSDTRV